MEASAHLLQSVSASFRWKTWIHGSGMWEYVPIDEPLLPWNQDATYLLSGCIFLQQDLEAGALPCCWLWLRQQKSSTHHLGPLYIWFLFQSTASHMCLCLSVRLDAPYHASPTHSSLSSVFLCSPNPSLNILLFSNKSRMVKEYRFQTDFFSVSCRVSLIVLHITHGNRCIFKRSTHLSKWRDPPGQRPQRGIQSRY